MTWTFRFEAEELFGLHARRHSAEARARRIDKHQVRKPQPRVFVVHEAVPRRQGRPPLADDRPFRPQRRQVQPDRRRPGTAVEGERDGTVLAPVVPRVRHVEHLRLQMPLLVPDRHQTRRGCVVQASAGHLHRVPRDARLLPVARLIIRAQRHPRRGLRLGRPRPPPGPALLPAGIHQGTAVRPEGVFGERMARTGLGGSANGKQTQQKRTTGPSYEVHVVSSGIPLVAAPPGRIPRSVPAWNASRARIHKYMMPRAARTSRPMPHLDGLPVLVCL